MKTRELIKILLTLMFATSMGCARKGDAYDTSTADIVGSSIAGAGAASDNSGSVVAFNQKSGETKPFSVAFKQFVSDTMLLPQANAAGGSCYLNALVQGQTCTGSNMTINLNGCVGLLGSVWTGTINLAFNSAAACTNASTSGLIAMGANNNVSLTSNSGVTRTALSGYYVVSDSMASGFSQTLSGGTSVACGGVDCTTGRTVTINGIHRALYDSAGTKLFDHTVSTPTSLSISGVGTSKVISSGSLLVQHNLAKFTATATITSPLTFTMSSGTCCHPTGGSVSVVFVSGSKSGSETINFGPGCGTASVNGNTFTLNYCQ